MTTPDEHLEVLRGFIRDYERMATEYFKDPAMVRRCERNAAAIRWILEQNAYGVTSDDIVG